MDEKSSSKSIEYVENDFSTLNAHVDGILYNEKQVSRLKKYRVDRVRIKQFGLIVLILGILVFLAFFGTDTVVAIWQLIASFF